ncbi:MAG: flagellar protein FlgN [Clostridia bacterium]|nr:flagellar protein FlgN [Clostridia bacterium]
MASMSDELLNVLTNELTIYSKLANFANEKKTFLVKSKVDKIMDITEKEQILITELKKQEKKREEVLNDLKVALNDKDLTLGKLVKRLPDNDRKKFVDLKSSILDEVEKLRMINKQNELLINEGLNMTEYTLNAIQGYSMMNENSYGKEVGAYGGNGHSQARFFESRS